MPSLVPRARSWIWGGSALAGGLLLYVCDDCVGTLPPQGLQRTIFYVVEVLVMGPAMGLLAFLLSEQRQTREALYQARLERERQLRFQFLGRIAASMAHEVRNPLHNLVLLTSELRKDVPAEQRELCDRIQGNLTRLDSATQLIYELARPQRRMPDEEAGAVLLAPLVASVCDELRSAHAGARIEIEDPPVNLAASGRTEGVRIILQNLIRNAVQAADTAVVRISCYQRPGRVGVEIRNPGHVLPDAAEEDGPQQAKPGSLGVGLSIARHLAALAGATVELTGDAGWVTARLDMAQAE